MMHRMFAAAALAVASLAGVASADTFDFNTAQNYLPSGGGWTVDRHIPAQFEASGGPNGKLITSVDSGDYMGEGSQAFYNTQGMQHALTPISGNQSLSFQMLVDTDGWSGVSNLRSGVWGVGYDGSNSVSYYPIISYIKGALAGQDANGAGFYAWNEQDSSWRFLSAGTDDVYNTLSIVLNVGTGFSYYVNGVQASYTTPDTATQTLKNVIVDSRNYNESYTAHFDNITTAAVPLPASAWSGLALLGLLFGAKALNRRPQTA